MRIIKPSRLLEFAEAYPRAAPSVLHWLETTKKAQWSNLAATRRDFPHADEVRVASHKPVTIFNISGNAFRRITAIHYNTGIVFVLNFLTHADYDKDRWKSRL